MQYHAVCLCYVGGEVVGTEEVEETWDIGGDYFFQRV